MSNEYKISKILRLISALMLFLALERHPYSYYILLRWVVSLSSFYSSYVLSKLGKEVWAQFFLISGVLFNPILPIYLDRSTWQLIDLFFGIIFCFSIFIKVNNFFFNN